MFKTAISCVVQFSSVQFNSIQFSSVQLSIVKHSLSKIITEHYNNVIQALYD